MIKRLISILIFLSAARYGALAFAEGPMYQNKDNVTQLEFDNAYSDLRSKVPTTTLTSNTSGQMLVGQGTGNNPIWGFSGRILQIKTFTSTTETSTTSSSFQVTTTTGIITPIQNGSSILILASGRFRNSAVNSDSCYATLLRNGSNLGASGGIVEFGYSAGPTSAEATPLSLIYVDQPNLTTQVGYAVAIRNSAGSITCTLGNTGSNKQILTLIEIGQ